jgi:DNA invertase Pin-like site-specific DNA recombinase
MKSELVKPIHLARKAVVYVRQSTTHQVANNQESLRLQYALRQRARELGWHEADIDVIDADLGISGASAAQRGGFKELVGRVGLSEVGLILSIDVTRLARNCSDWYPLLDICGMRGCLIADRDGVYDPASANGRLLLGLKGTISELELHTIRSRLTSGLLAKAERGELALTLPIGLVRDLTGIVVKDPNIEVQERLQLLFQTFLKVIVSRDQASIAACAHRRQGDAYVQRPRPRSAAAGLPWRSALGTGDDRGRCGDFEESCLCWRVRLRANPPAENAGRRSIADEGGNADRGMADRRRDACLIAAAENRQRPLSRLYRLANLRENPKHHLRQPSRIYAQQDQGCSTRG